MQRSRVLILCALFGVILVDLLILLTHTQRFNHPIKTGRSFQQVVYVPSITATGERLTITPIEERSTITTTADTPTITTTADTPTITATKEGNKQNRTTNYLQGKVLVTATSGFICGATRLGNKLSMLSAAIGAAAAKNMTFVVIQPSERCKWMYRLQELFAVLQTTPAVSIEEVNSWGSVDEKGGFIYTDIPSDRNVSLKGYRQTWKYFSSRRQQEAVRRTFKFTERYENRARETLFNATNLFHHIQQPILVGVHMRLGDIVHIKSGKRVATKKFYDIVFKIVRSYFNDSNNIIFVAGSDSPELGKSMLSDASKIYNIFWAGGTDLEDFATLSSCNHSVISGGTYGFWTAWLAGGQTFYNANFSIPNTFWGNWYIEENANLPDWIPVGWL